MLATVCPNWLSILETTVEETNQQSVTAENKGRARRPRQSCQPLLPFHPDNAPPSKVKTSPLLNRTLAARFISADYAFKCRFARNINAAKNPGLSPHPPPTTTGPVLETQAASAPTPPRRKRQTSCRVVNEKEELQIWSNRKLRLLLGSLFNQLH